VFGSDTPSAPTYANPPGYNGYLEMLALEKAGISPREILVAATSANAELFGLTVDYGTIEPGKRAALIAVRVPVDVGDVEEYLLSGITASDIAWVS
jgi:imidazolonepropionase-like amidohydrolase